MSGSNARARSWPTRPKVKLLHLQPKRITLIATIGTFSQAKDGFVGTIRTMTINVKTKIVANDQKANNKAPDFRIFAGGAELGAAWREKSTGDEPRDYLAVQLDDPSFAEPIRAAFFENVEEGTGVLVWNRREA